MLKTKRENRARKPELGNGQFSSWTKVIGAALCRLTGNTTYVTALVKCNA